jgi:hypothetical protein
MPRTNPIFTMFEPKAFPMATPMVCSPTTEKMDTLSADRDVQKATKIKPVAVLPKPVIPAIVTELVIVKSLVLSRMISEATRISTLPINPNSSSTVASPLLIALRSEAKNIL